MADDDMKPTRKTQTQRVLAPKKIYLKDASFEAPNSPGIFEEKWKPTLEVEIDSNATEIAENSYEVVMTVSVRAIVEGKTAYMAEVHQAGIFHLNGFEPEAIQRATNVFCLRYMFPYASAELIRPRQQGRLSAAAAESDQFQSPVRTAPAKCPGTSGRRGVRTRCLTSVRSFHPASPAEPMLLWPVTR